MNKPAKEMSQENITGGLGNVPLGTGIISGIPVWIPDMFPGPPDTFPGYIGPFPGLHLMEIFDILPPDH